MIAAGLSSRMGEFKPLLDIGGKPAVFRLLDSISAADIEDIIVVTGHKHDVIEAALKRAGNHRLSTIYNENFALGMFSSIQAGIRAASGYDAALLFPVDVPLVSAETITGLINAWEGTPARPDAPFAVPVFKDKNGHPLLIPSGRFGEIATYTGEGGLKAIRDKYADTMLRYDSGDEGCVLDIDTPEDYASIREYYGSFGYYEQKRK